MRWSRQSRRIVPITLWRTKIRSRLFPIWSKGPDGVLHPHDVAYYNATRPHRTLGLEPPEGPRSVHREGTVVAIPVLGGLHHRYERVAA